MKKQILFIEDDEEMLEEIKEILENFGYETHSALNGLKAKKILENKKNFDLILLDLKIPELDGFELIKIIKNKKIKSKIIVLSSSQFSFTSDEMKKNLNITNDDKEKLLNNVDFILKKPIKIDILLNKIQQLI
jgi:CheY-like chemotaxis protein